MHLRGQGKALRESSKESHKRKNKEEEKGKGKMSALVFLLV